MKITPEEAERMGRKAQALEEGFEGSVLAGRPSGAPLSELVLEHEKQQRGIRWLAIVSNATSIVAIGISAALGSVGFMIAAGAFGAFGLALLVASARRERAFESRVRSLSVSRTRVVA